MSFYLNRTFISDEYLRQRLLNNDKAPSLYESINSTDMADIDTDNTKIFEKLHVSESAPPMLEMEDLINKLIEIVQSNNDSRTYSEKTRMLDDISFLSTLTYDQLLALLYLLYSNTITLEDLLEIESTSNRTRSEMILSRLNNLPKPDSADIFKPLINLVEAIPVASKVTLKSKLIDNYAIDLDDSIIVPKIAADIYASIYDDNDKIILKGLGMKAVLTDTEKNEFKLIFGNAGNLKSYMLSNNTTLNNAFRESMQAPWYEKLAATLLIATSFIVAPVAVVGGVAVTMLTADALKNMKTDDIIKSDSYKYSYTAAYNIISAANVIGIIVEDTSTNESVAVHTNTIFSSLLADALLKYSCDSSYNDSLSVIKTYDIFKECSEIIKTETSCWITDNIWESESDPPISRYIKVGKDMV